MDFYDNFKELGINTKAETLFSVNFDIKGIYFSKHIFRNNFFWKNYFFLFPLSLRKPKNS